MAAADPRAGAAGRRHRHAQPRLAALARRHRRVRDRAQVQRRRPQAGGRVLASAARSRRSATSSWTRSPASWPSPPPRLTGPMTALFLVDKPAGPTSFDVLRALRPALGASSGTPARSTRSRPACCWCWPGARRGWRPSCPGWTRATGRSSSSAPVVDHARPRGRDRADRRTTDGGRCARPRPALVGDDRPAGAAGVGGARGRRALLRAHAPRRGGGAARRGGRIDRLDVIEFDAALQRATIEVACSKGTYVRQIAADLGEATGGRRATAWSCGGWRRPFLGRPMPAPPTQIAGDPRGRWALRPRDALPHLPERPLTTPSWQTCSHGRARRRPRDGRATCGWCTAASWWPSPSRTATAAAGGGARRVIDVWRSTRSPAARRAVAIGQLRRRPPRPPARDRARRAGRPERAACRSSVVTFHPHPMAVLRPELAPHELSTPARRAELVAELGPDELIVIPFDARVLAGRARAVRRARCWPDGWARGW